MNFPIPRIHTITTIDEALSAGCDCVMIKHAGWPMVIHCMGSEATVFSDWQWHHAKAEPLERFVPIEPVTALLVGAKDKNTPTIHVHDVWWLDGVSVKNETYRSRFILVKREVRKLDSRFAAVEPQPLSNAKTLWRTCQVQGHGGLVFRRSMDTSAGDLFVIRSYPELPRDLS